MSVYHLYLKGVKLRGVEHATDEELQDDLKFYQDVPDWPIGIV